MAVGVVEAAAVHEALHLDRVVRGGGAGLERLLYELVDFMGLTDVLPE